MQLLKRVVNSFLRKDPLFQPGAEGIYYPTKKNADAFFKPAFERIFLLLSLFRIKGDIYEFGVLLGYTARLFAQHLSDFKFKNSELHLFDSFEGLPELSHEDTQIAEAKSHIWKKGAMAVPQGIEKQIQKKLEKLLGRGRVHVIKGFFEETVENYFKSKICKKAAVVHLDCDLYSSSKCVLTKLFEYDLIQDGTLLICDDWMCSRGHPQHGQKMALTDTLEDFPGWQVEPYFNYGLGSQVLVVHDLRECPKIKQNAQLQMSDLIDNTP